MAKSEYAKTQMILENYFKIGSHTAKKQFEQLFIEDDGEELCNVFLMFLDERIEDIVLIPDSDYVFKALRYVEVLIEKYPNLNRKKISRKLCRLVEKLERVSSEKEVYNKNKVDKKISKFNDLVYDLDEKLELKENKYYELLEYFIFNKDHNIDYIEEVLHVLPASLKALNVRGETVFFNVIKKYVENILNDEEQEVLFYKNVTSLIKNQKSFKLSNFEKQKLLQYIYHEIDLMPKKVEKYKEKQEDLSQLVDILKSEDNQNSIKNIANYYNIKIDFDDELIDELSLYQTGYSKIKYPDRKIVKDYMVTIDGHGAKEIDDGLTAKVLKNGNYLLGVHIASVLAYLPFESELVQEAISRGSCIYLAKNKIYSSEDDYSSVITIFPPDFSADSASLLENKLRFANSYFFEIDKNGNIIREKFEKTIVKNDRQCTYDEVNDILSNGNCKDRDLEKTLNILAEISCVLENKYHPSEIYQALKAQSNNPAKVILGNSIAEHIVQGAMTMTGSEVGEWFKNPSRDYPCLLRVHEIDEECNEKLQDTIDTFSTYKDNEKFERLFEALVGIYPKAHYDLKGRHDGMNLDHYCHVTSPLRRSSDIIQEYALNVCYFNHPSDKQLYDLEQMLKENKEVINAQNNAIDYFLDDCKIQKKLLRKSK